eukprot:607099-Prymnesium_polylepis.1
MSWSTRVQYCGVPPRSMVWSSAGAVPRAGHRHRVVSAELEHRPLGQPRKRQAARPPVSRHAEPAAA